MAKVSAWPTMGYGQEDHRGPRNYTHVLQYKLDSKFCACSIQLYVTHSNPSTKALLNTRQTASMIDLKATSRPTQLQKVRNIMHSICETGCKHAFPTTPIVRSSNENPQTHLIDHQGYLKSMETDSSFGITTLHKSNIPTLRSVTCGVPIQPTNLYSKRQI
jgi:hypothetical protein